MADAGIEEFIEVLMYDIDDMVSSQKCEKVNITLQPRLKFEVSEGH